MKSHYKYKEGYYPIFKVTGEDQDVRCYTAVDDCPDQITFWREAYTEFSIEGMLEELAKSSYDSYYEENYEGRQRESLQASYVASIPLLICSTEEVLSDGAKVLPHSKLISLLQSCDGDYISSRKVSEIFDTYVLKAISPEKSDYETPILNIRVLVKGAIGDLIPIAKHLASEGQGGGVQYNPYCIGEHTGNIVHIY